MAQQEIRLQLGTPQIQMAIFEPQLLGWQLFALVAVNRDGRWFGWSDDSECRPVNFHLACRQLRIFPVSGTSSHVPLDYHHRFGFRGLRLSHQLG